jgi:hypothetical protein
MPEGYKQPISAELTRELEEMLDRFCDAHKPGNPDMHNALEEAEGKMRVAIQGSNPDGGIALVATAKALRDHIRATRNNRSYVRRSIPSDPTG